MSISDVTGVANKPNYIPPSLPMPGRSGDHAPLPSEPQMEEQSGREIAVTEDQVIAAIEQANQKFEVYDTRLEFSIHEKTRQIMIKVMKEEQVIREIPPEKILDMVARFMEMAGILVDEQV